MNRYTVPKIVCAMGAIVILAGIFYSELNITLGNMPKSILIAVGIVAVLLLFTVLAFKMKISNMKRYFRKSIKCRTIEYASIVSFAVAGIVSLAVFNHCITVWLQTEAIKKELNIRQLEKMFSEYETYANQRIVNYTEQLNEAIRYKDMKQSELANLGFNVNLGEALESRKTRKTNKIKQVVYPHIYDSLKVSITDSITKFIDIVETFSPLTLPKNVKVFKQAAKTWEKQLVYFSHYKMKGESADDFQFSSTFGNVESVLTEYKDYFSTKRLRGYIIGLIALLCMLFPYFVGQRSMKFKTQKRQ